MLTCHQLGASRCSFCHWYLKLTFEVQYYVFIFLYIFLLKWEFESCVSSARFKIFFEWTKQNRNMGKMRGIKKLRFLENIYISEFLYESEIFFSFFPHVCICILLWASLSQQMLKRFIISVRHLISSVKKKTFTVLKSLALYPL